MPQLDPPPHQMTKAEFVFTCGGVYEHSQWVAEGVWQFGLDPADVYTERLADKMAAIKKVACRSQQMALLCAHPELAGKLAISGHMTTESTSEQAGAGLNHCSQEELSEFQELNHKYTEKFGHPFIIAVRGLNCHKILVEFRRRLKASPEDEFATSISEVHKIAFLRLQELSQNKLSQCKIRLTSDTRI